MTVKPPRLKLRRCPLMPDSEYLSKYAHPNGWRILRCKRSWSERVGAMRGASLAGPLYWWEVRTSPHRGRFSMDFATLAEARDWCDAHDPRDIHRT